MAAPVGTRVKEAVEEPVTVGGALPAAGEVGTPVAVADGVPGSVAVDVREALYDAAAVSDGGAVRVGVPLAVLGAVNDSV